MRSRMADSTRLATVSPLRSLIYRQIWARSVAASGERTYRGFILAGLLIGRDAALVDLRGFLCRDPVGPGRVEFWLHVLHDFPKASDPVLPAYPEDEAEPLPRFASL